MNRDRRVLCVLWDGGGNVPPQLAIVRRLVETGSTVRVLAPAHLAAQIDKAGARHVRFRYVAEHNSASPTTDLLQDWRARTPMEAAGYVRNRIMIGTAHAYARDVLAALEDEPADVIVTDYMLLGAYLAAESAGVPLVSLIHHVYPLPAAGSPPFGLGLQPMEGPLGKLRDAILSRLVLKLYLGGPAPLNAVRRDLGLSPVSQVVEMFSKPTRTLVLTSRAFDYPRVRLPDQVETVGFAADSVREGSSDDVDGNTPLVVVGFSTTFQNHEAVLRTTVDALAGIPVRALVTTGPAISPAALPAAHNVEIRPFLPHQEAFANASAVVTHGGHGTVMTALSCGVPVLVVPMGRDQPDVAARLVYHGAGLKAGKVTSSTIRQQVQRLITEPSFRKNAQRIGHVMASEDGAGTAAGVIERIAAAHQVTVAENAVDRSLSPRP